MTERDRRRTGTYDDGWFAERYLRHWEPVLAGRAFAAGSKPFSRTPLCSGPGIIDALGRRPA